MAGDDAAFSSQYLLLDADKVSPLDLVRVLVSRKVGKAKFVECGAGLEELGFGWRWVVFLSGLAMALLRFVRRPMAAIGSALELSLNFLPTNHGLGGLLQNLLKGKVEIPDKESASFVSVVGKIDRRMDLESHILPQDKRYNALLTLMASKLSYENAAFIKSVVTDHWEKDFLGSYKFWNDFQGKCSTEAFLLRDPKTIVVSFRGTQPFSADDWSTDVDISWYELPGVGKAHAGFMKALGLQKRLGWPKEIPDSHTHQAPAYYAIRGMLREILKEGGRFVVTGHSLGGALAVLFTGVLAMHGEEWVLERLGGVYTYGQPRVGDERLGEFMAENLRKRGIGYYRFVYNNDIVPRLPFDNGDFMFKHFAPALFFNSLYKGKCVKVEPNKNYFSLRAAIPMYVGAVWEMIRSFVAQYIWGEGLKESWLLRFMRVFGLLFPGLADHVLQDYDNITRVGSLQRKQAPEFPSWAN